MTPYFELVAEHWLNCDCTSCGCHCGTESDPACADYDTCLEFDGCGCECSNTTCRRDALIDAESDTWQDFGIDWRFAGAFEEDTLTLALKAAYRAGAGPRLGDAATITRYAALILEEFRYGNVPELAQYR